MMFSLSSLLSYLNIFRKFLCEILKFMISPPFPAYDMINPHANLPIARSHS